MQVRRKKTCYSGLAIVETAIVFPILLLITLGVIHFAWLFLKAHQITAIARDGARRYSLYNADWTDVEDYVNTKLQTAGISGATVAPLGGTVAGRTCVGVKITVLPADVAKYVAILNLSGFGVPTPGLGAAVTMVKEGS
jgi:Flp pilus assembly protein TadG